MRIYEGQVPSIARDIASALISGELIEVEAHNHSEVELDIEAVLKEYIRQARELTERAKDISEQRGSGYSSVHRIKRGLARDINFKKGEDGLEYIVQQLLEAFMHTMFVEEIFGDDLDMRRTITPVLKRHLGMEEKVDQEVRDKIKNLKEGTASWDIEYQKVKDKIERKRGLD